MTHRSPDEIDAWLKTLPPRYRIAWLLLSEKGLATAIVVVVVVASVYWLFRVSVPESAIRTQVLTRVMETNERVAKTSDDVLRVAERVLSVSERLAVNQEAQTKWMSEWKLYISDQHIQRAKEAAAIIGHQNNAEAFFKRTDEIHMEQIKVLKELTGELRQMREESRPKNLPTPQSGGDPMS